MRDTTSVTIEGFVLDAVCNRTTQKFWIRSHINEKEYVDVCCYLATPNKNENSLRLTGGEIVRVVGKLKLAVENIEVKK